MDQQEEQQNYTEQPIVTEEPQAENVQQEDEIQQPQITSSDSSALVDALFKATALPQNSDTQFLYVTNQSPVKSYERSPAVMSFLNVMLESLDHNEKAAQELFVLILNSGNFIEVECELMRQVAAGQVNNSKWQQIARAIVSLRSNQTYHLKRMYIMRMPFIELGGESQQEAIEQAKQAIVSQTSLSVNIDEISWDSISYKIQPTTSEYFSQLHPQLISKLNQASVSLMDETQDQLFNMLLLKLSQSRALQGDQQQEDEFVTDLSVFLESQIAGFEDQSRQQRILGYGDTVLIRYIATMNPLFLTGNIPGTIAPIKITACQDMVSNTELRGSIQSLAEQQLLQKDEAMPNPNIRRQMRILGDESQFMSNWSVKQSTSLEQASRITNQLNTVMKRSFDEDAYIPQKNLGQQLSGGSNKFYDQLHLQRQGDVVNLTPADTELLRQCLSTLLACLRVRFDAVSATKFELVTSEDLDHFEICRRLSQYCDPNAQQTIYELASVLSEQITGGHNIITHSGFGLPQDVNDSIAMTLEKHAQNILQQIPLFQADVQEGSGMFKSIMQCMYLALANNNRIKEEVKLRLQRRQILFNAIQRFQ